MEASTSELKAKAVTLEEFRARAATLPPPSPGDIVTLRTNSWPVQVRVTSIEGERFAGVVVECPFGPFIGKVVEHHQRYLWPRRVR